MIKKVFYLCAGSRRHSEIHSITRVAMPDSLSVCMNALIFVIIKARNIKFGMNVSVGLL